MKSFSWTALFALIPLAIDLRPSASDSMYPLDTCPVSGKKLGSMGEPVTQDYKGREIRFCCKECPAKFEKDPESFLKKVDEKIIQQQLPFYPLDTCLVSKEKLGGEMGEPINYVYNNRLVRFCCKSCIGKLQKDPASYLSKLDQAVIEKQKASYPLTTCVVSGEKLGGEMGASVDYVFANRLVRFCCKDCVKDFRKEPSKYTAKIDAAMKTGAPAKEGSGKKEDEKKPHDHGDHDHGGN